MSGTVNASARTAYDYGKRDVGSSRMTSPRLRVIPLNSLTLLASLMARGRSVLRFITSLVVRSATTSSLFGSQAPIRGSRPGCSFISEAGSRSIGVRPWRTPAQRRSGGLLRLMRSRFFVPLIRGCSSSATKRTWRFFFGRPLVSMGQQARSLRNSSRIVRASGLAFNNSIVAGASCRNRSLSR